MSRYDDGCKIRRVGFLLLALASFTLAAPCCGRRESLGTRATNSSPAPVDAERQVPSPAPAMPLQRAPALSDASLTDSRAVPFFEYRKQFAHGHQIHAFPFTRGIGLAITTGKGPARLFLVSSDRCRELPGNTSILPIVGVGLDMNKDPTVFGWVKPPCCADSPGRLGFEALLYLAAPDENAVTAIFEKWEEYGISMSTIEAFAFDGNDWRKEPWGRKKRQTFGSAYQSNQSLWVTECIGSSCYLIETQRGKVVVQHTAPSLPPGIQRGTVSRRGLDLHIFVDDTAISWGYLEDGRLLLERWESVRSGSGTAWLVDTVQLPKRALEEFRSNRTWHGVEHPGIEFEYISADSLVLARPGETRLRLTFDRAEKRWFAAEEASPTTQERVTEMLALNTEPRAQADSVKLLENTWVAVRKRQTEHVIEVFTNDDGLARCGTITKEPYVYHPSAPEHELHDAGR